MPYYDTLGVEIASGSLGVENSELLCFIIFVDKL
jgi:hypothetical protein